MVLLCEDGLQGVTEKLKGSAVGMLLQTDRALLQIISNMSQSKTRICNTRFISSYTATYYRANIKDTQTENQEYTTPTAFVPVSFLPSIHMQNAGEVLTIQCTVQLFNYSLFIRTGRFGDLELRNFILYIYY